MGASRGESLGVPMPQAWETAPFSCRLEDATSGNKQQLELEQAVAILGKCREGTG